MKTASKIPNISRDCRSQAGNILQINLIFLWTMSTTLPIVLYVSKPYRKLRKRANETQRICRETLTDLDALTDRHAGTLICYISDKLFKPVKC